MGKRTEYVSTLVLTQEQVVDLQLFHQRFVADIDNPSISTSQVEGWLGSVSTILGIISLASNFSKAGIASSIVAIIASFVSPSTKELIKELAKAGKSGLGDIVAVMVAGDYDAVELDCPMLEFVDEELRIVQGELYLRRLRKNGVWFNSGGPQ